MIVINNKKNLKLIITICLVVVLAFVSLKIFVFNKKNLTIKSGGQNFETEYENTDLDSTNGENEGNIPNENNESDKDDLEPIEIDVVTTDLKKNVGFKFDVSNGPLEMSFGTPWKENDKNISVGIEGRGEEAIEQGVGFILIKDSKKSETKLLSLGEGGETMAPKYVEWYDDDNFLVYMVGKDSREFTKGTLYLVNSKNYDIKTVYEANENEEIVETTTIDKNTINIKTIEYNENAGVAKEKNINIK